MRQVEKSPLGAPAEELVFQRILYEKKGYTATITINRADVLNCFDYVTLKELSAALADANVDDAVAVVVLTGAGDRAFCGGADLKEHDDHLLAKPNQLYKWMQMLIEVHDRLRGIGKPTIARLNGLTSGGGSELAMACDLAIAADHVSIRQSGADRGTVAATGATQWLPMLVGDRRAREMLFLCEPIDAYTALEWGLVTQVVPAALLDKSVAELAEKLYHKTSESLRYTKFQLNFWKDFAWSQTIGHAREWLTQHAGSREMAEGLRAFRSKGEVEYAALRNAQTNTAPQAAEREELRDCTACSARLPATFAYCGACGAKFPD
jgi:enoyl-CoA hydratase/carnithine racemase